MYWLCVKANEHGIWCDGSGCGSLGPNGEKKSDWITPCMRERDMDMDNDKRSKWQKTEPYVLWSI